MHPQTPSSSRQYAQTQPYLRLHPTHTFKKSRHVSRTRNESVLLALLPRSSTNPHCAFAIPFPAPAPAPAPTGGGDAVGERKDPCVTPSYAPASVCAFASVCVCVGVATPPTGEVNILSMRARQAPRAPPRLPPLASRRVHRKQRNAYIYFLYIHTHATTRVRSRGVQRRRDRIKSFAEKKRLRHRRFLAQIFLPRARDDDDDAVVLSRSRPDDRTRL